jgi:hypothetical protein
MTYLHIQGFFFQNRKKKCQKVTVTMLPDNNLELSWATVAISQQYFEQDVKVYDDDLLIQLPTS